MGVVTVNQVAQWAALIRWGLNKDSEEVVVRMRVPGRRRCS